MNFKLFIVIFIATTSHLSWGMEQDTSTQEQEMQDLMKKLAIFDEEYQFSGLTLEEDKKRSLTLSNQIMSFQKQFENFDENIDFASLGGQVHDAIVANMQYAQNLQQEFSDIVAWISRQYALRACDRPTLITIYAKIQYAQNLGQEFCDVNTRIRYLTPVYITAASLQTPSGQAMIEAYKQEKAQRIMKVEEWLHKDAKQ